MIILPGSALYVERSGVTMPLAGIGAQSVRDRGVSEGPGRLGRRGPALLGAAQTVHPGAGTKRLNHTLFPQYSPSLGVGGGGSWK